MTNGWIQNLVEIWQRQDVDAALELFKACTNYRETPFAVNAATQTNGIRLLWNEVMQQSNLSITASIRMETGEETLASYNAIYLMNGLRHRTSGLWLVKFKSRQCVSFEQWSVESKT